MMRPVYRPLCVLAGLMCALGACGLTNLKVDPVKVEPIHVTIDVNLHNAPAATPATAPTPAHP